MTDPAPTVPELLRRIASLEEENAMLREQATIDLLTGIYNQRGFFDGMDKQFIEDKPETPWPNEERRERRRSHINGTLVLLDLTGFKGVNDAISRASGDEFLILVAHTLKEQVRDITDIVARYGGDEFTLFFRGRNKQFVDERMEVIRRRVKDITLGMSEEEIRQKLNRDFLADFHHASTWVDRKVDFKKLLQHMNDTLKKREDSLRLSHLGK
jgi:diguanylate cyclase (GGDEF)-like protein